MKWTEERYQRLLELKEQGFTHREIIEIFKHEYDVELTLDTISSKLYNERKRRKNVRRDKQHKQKVTTNKKGITESSTVIAMQEGADKDEYYILKAHGFDPERFELLSVTNNFWQQNNTQDGLVNLYQSKIKVKPLPNNLINYDGIIKRLTKEIEPISKIHNISRGDEYLLVSLFDLHFGNSTIEDYQLSLDKTRYRISQGYKEILIIVGGDLLHNDNHRGTTSSGTVIDKVDMTKAWDMAFDYLLSIIETSLQYAPKVEVMYVPGNHDEMVGQTVIKALERYLANSHVTFDSEQEMFKARLLGKNFIGATHGDKATIKRYPMIYATSFATLWGADGVITRELFTGHLHKELWGDLDGLFFRQAPTRNRLDQYHKDNGFVTAQKRFQLVSYDEYEPTSVMYV